MCPIRNLLCAGGRCGRALIPAIEQHGCHNRSGIKSDIPCVSCLPPGTRSGLIPLALMYLKASLVGRAACAADGITLLEFDEADGADVIADAVVEARPECSGLVVLRMECHDPLAVARLIRERTPAVRMILGALKSGPSPRTCFELIRVSTRSFTARGKSR